MTGPPTRREFLQRSGAVAAMGGLAAGVETRGEPPAAVGTWVIDCHAHLHHHSRATWRDDDRALIDAADRIGIDALCCSILTPVRPATAEGFRECNRWVFEGVKRFPGRIHGYCYVNPGCEAEAVEEVRRCIQDHGFIGVKL